MMGQMGCVAKALPFFQPLSPIARSAAGVSDRDDFQDVANQAVHNLVAVVANTHFANTGSIHSP
jgi:hypothetical protein